MPHKHSPNLKDALALLGREDLVPPAVTLGPGATLATALAGLGLGAGMLAGEEGVASCRHSFGVAELTLNGLRHLDSYGAWKGRYVAGSVPAFDVLTCGMVGFRSRATPYMVPPKRPTRVKLQRFSEVLPDVDLRELGRYGWHALDTLPPWSDEIEALTFFYPYNADQVAPESLYWVVTPDGNLTPCSTENLLWAGLAVKHLVMRGIARWATDSRFVVIV